jgi:hypothetical protein
MQLHEAPDLMTLRRRCKASLDAQRRRAAADRQELGYDLADLLALVRQAERCCYCGAPLSPATFALDHATPTCRTADYSFDNVAACCGACNAAKGLLSAAEFRALLALIGDWHPRARVDVLAKLRAGGKRFAGR